MPMGGDELELIADRLGLGGAPDFEAVESAGIDEPRSVVLTINGERMNQSAPGISPVSKKDS